MACCHHDAAPARETRYRRILWFALLANAVMFVVEAIAGLGAGSAALEADALDFLGDAATFAISLLVLDRALAWRARAALLKGAAMGVVALAVLADVAVKAFTGVPPVAMTMGIVGALALATNLGVAALLFAHRGGDANRRSAWLCSRNDAIGNVAVMIAASGVIASGAAWPDLVVGGLMAALGLAAAGSILSQARGELARDRTAAAAAD